MKTVISTHFDPYFNLAWEEYIFKNIHQHEDIFLLWQNSESIIVGRNQNVFEEVNLDYIVKNHIPLIRRNSGGGTVFHDLGNLNFTFMTDAKGKINNYQLMTEKLVSAFQALGINLKFSGKSDLKIGELKVSGNAQYIYKDKLLHHGTLLFNSNLERLSNSLKSKTDDIESISVKSNRSTVTNISSYTNLTMDELKKYLIQELTSNEFIELTPKDLKRIEELQVEKYQTYQWNYGESPRSRIKKSKGIYSIDISLAYGNIEDAKIIKDGSLDLLLSSSIVGLRCYPSELSFLIKKAPEVYEMLFL
ncbi:lipoate--protein ligase family protein [Acholeplasma equifetale]|uniref:lipoate--protein ligase family protein n=1 Tax=Acholeplasma equifetale TaxID=264634 RepID=UPI0005518470|nr:lipoate--protein ligase [Acholeplasma equifetale]